jgi:hypothetical protein
MMGEQTLMPVSDYVEEYETTEENSKSGIGQEERRDGSRLTNHEIAPRRFNPKGEAWLPVMKVERDGWEMRVLFSDTRRAHRLGRTRDWGVIYYDRNGEHGQATVVTARSGSLEGERAVRGREAECRVYYDGKRAGP